jgi:predicted glycosyltransferase
MDQAPVVSVLLAPLDWGLGHATRCIPIIKELRRQGVRVWVAASGPQESLLRHEFPGLEFLAIPGYPIRYNRGRLLKWGLVLRIPAILRQIRREHTWLDQCLQTYPIDAVISDNRYGLYHKNLPCVLITHQLTIQSGVQNPRSSSGIRGMIGRRIDRKIQQLHYRFITRFTECWVPDQEGTDSLAGLLSHPEVFPKIPVRYIGVLSRFEPCEENTIKNSLLVLLSGPEPQRTLLEKILIGQLADLNLKIVLIRGLPGNPKPILKIGQVEVFNHMDSIQLGQLIKSAELIVARSGYSTVMDLIRLQKSALLIPTPGQTEQEYLGRYLHEKKWMYTVSQEKFNLENSLAAFKKIKFLHPDIKPSPLNKVIKDLLSNCFKRKNTGVLA